MKKHCCIFLLLFISAFSSHASHIVGAQLYYDCMGNNTYRITFVEYRNCSANCPQCAPYADPEYIQVFDTAGNYIDSFSAPLPIPDTIVTIGINSCDYCIEVVYYQTTATLPYIPGGYILVYQRCCRNSAISNIPNNTGATYFTVIPDSAEVPGCDSKPRFDTLYPQFFPIDTPFTFSMAATDPDGDSIAYRFANSYDGASSACPNPSPGGAGSGCNTSASSPPYLSVPYIAPFTATNPTNNPSDSGDLQIDPHTGIISGTVNQTGIFLVAAAADEYRNGTLIGTTLLDFQFIFGACSTPINAINKISGQSNIRIYSTGSEAVIDMSNQSIGPANISFYDLLGQQIAIDNAYTGSVYTRQFQNMPTQYIIARVQLSDGQLIYKKLLIEGGN